MNKRIKFLLTSLVMIIGIGINVTNNCYCMLPDTDNNINVMQNINNNINDVLEYYYIHNIKSYNDFLNNCNIINGGVLQSIYPSYITQDHIRPTILGLIRYCSNISDKIGSYLHDVFPNNDDYKEEANRLINIKLLNDIVGNTYIKDKKSVTFQQFLNYLSNKICFVVMQCIYNIENLIKSNKNIDWKVIKDEINLCYKNVTNILDKLKTISFGKELIDAVYQDDNVKVWNKRIIKVMQNINDNNINVNIMQNKNNNINNNVNNNINVIHNKNNS